jgi:hypothetical protein
MPTQPSEASEDLAVIRELLTLLVLFVAIGGFWLAARAMG